MILNLKDNLILSASFYVAFVFLFSSSSPAEAVTNNLYVNYFVGEELVDVKCNDRICSNGNDVFRIDENNMIVSIIKNTHFDSELECKMVMDMYVNRIKDVGYFPLFSNKVDFGGVFEVNKKNYHASMKCDKGFMLASIRII